MKFVVTMPEGPVFETFWSPDERRQLEALGEVQWNTLGRQFTPEELAEHLCGAEVCVTGWGAPVFSRRQYRMAHRPSRKKNAISDRAVVKLNGSR